MSLNKKPMLGLTIAVSAALVLSSCSGGDPAADLGFEDCEDDPAGCNSGPARDGDEVVWAVDSGWNTWSEVHSTYSGAAGDVLAPIFPKTGTWLPDGEWELNSHIYDEEPELINEDPLQVEYFLNPDATWGDGNSIGLDDFIYNWYSWSNDTDLCALGCEPRSTAWGPFVEDIDENEDGNVVITYTDGYQSPEWMYAPVLSNPAHLAEEYGYEDWQDDPDVMAESLLNFVETRPEYSAGPYIMVDGDFGDYVSYEINEEYDGDTQPTISNLRIEFVESTSSIITEMRQGAVHGATPGRYDPEDLDLLRNSSGIRYNVAPGPGWQTLTLNLNNRFLQDPDLREAVMVAYDVDEVIDRTTRLSYDRVQRRGNHIFPNSSDYYTDFLSGTPQGSGDVFFASEILEDAGYEWQDAELYTPDGDQVVLEYRLPVEGGNSQTQAELFQSIMGELGITVEFNTFQPNDFSEMLSQGEFDVVAFQWLSSPTFANAATQYWHSGSNSNFGGLESEELDEAVNAVLETTDLDEAAERANEAAKLAAEEAYMLPISDNPVLILVNEDLVNVRDNWANQQRGLYNIQEWGWLDEEA